MSTSPDLGFLKISKTFFQRAAFFSSVVPSVYLLFKRFLKKEFGISSFDIKDKRLKKVVKINIKYPHQVGSDRIANASAVYKIHKSNCIIIDFGTATTFDVVTNKGVYNGGVIAPGIELSIKNLHQATAQLPLLKLKKVKKIIGKNTVEAMSSGFYWGYLGLIDNIVQLVKRETKNKFKIILTGGFSFLFKNSLKYKVIIDKDITIKGLIKILKIKKGLK